jgi:hypothetical protein
MLHAKSIATFAIWHSSLSAAEGPYQVSASACAEHSMSLAVWEVDLACAGCEQ